MKKGFLFAAALLIVFGVIGIFSLKGIKKHKSHPVSYNVTEEKPFVVIIPSYNNSKYCEKNLHSVFTQNYQNYRVIYIDDASKDDTFKKVKDFIQKSHQENRCTVIRNDTNQGALANFYHSIHTCKPQEIIVTLDGDDYLAHEEVLSKLNKTYANPNTWMTYGNFVDYPTYTQKPIACKKVPESVIQNNNYRKKEWMTSHLRSFYARLFQKIKLQDLLFEGRFFPMASDCAFMMPMLEMAGKHARFIHEILYLYNRANPLNDHKINFTLQTACNKAVRKLPRYSRLKKIDLTSDTPSYDVDMVIFSYDRPLQLYALLESVEQYTSPIRKISLIYRVSNEKFDKAYEEVKKEFPHIEFIKQSDQPDDDFQPLLLKILFEDSTSPYVVFAVDDVIVKDDVDFNQCIQTMEKTGAYGFFLSHGIHLDYCYMQDQNQKIPPHITVEQGIHAWQFKQGQSDWIYPNSLDMVIYRKAEIEKDFRKISFKNPNTLEHFWNLRSRLKKVGLFYDISKSVNVPLNTVNPSLNKSMNAFSSIELLDFFEKGLKIDIADLYQIQNSSKHIDYIPTFISRSQN